MGFVVLAESGERLDVGKIVAAGKNYADHVREMGGPPPSEPVFFLKPSTSIVHEGEPIVFPTSGRLLHHEVELGVVVSTSCSRIGPKDAGDFILGYFLALDLTLRDLQDEAKKKGHPWSASKGFDCACPVSRVLPVPDAAALGNLELGLSVNGEVRQHGSTSHMLRSTEELVAAGSHLFTLERGDLLLTGTPAGVGPLERGDSVEAWLGDALRIRFDVV
jgi:2-keto-4-pentenoate hydratase/2-oxohepta-3-ene-1,7-dioic acid hydratase in catechol pathway